MPRRTLLRRDVEAREPRRPARRRDRRRQHADRRRLSGSVRAQQSEHLAGPHLEVDVLHRFDAARVRLAQPGDLDRKLVVHREPPLGGHIDRVGFVTLMTDPDRRM